MVGAVLITALHLLTTEAPGPPFTVCKVGPTLVQCSTVQYSTVQYSTVQYSTVQYSMKRGERKLGNYDKSAGR